MSGHLHFCTGLIDSEAAEIVAKRHGIAAQEYEQLSSHANKDDDFECEGCGDIVRNGSIGYWKPGGGEYYYEGSSYGSPTCATLQWQSSPGGAGDWLERLGWEFGGWDGNYFAEKGKPYIWFKRAEHPHDECMFGPIIAREGGPSYRRDLARARKLAKEFLAVRRELRKERKNESKS